MITRKFVWELNDELGAYGWRLTTAPHFDAYASGLTVAHDSIEHFAPTGNDLRDEWLAFGHILWLRAGGDYWHQIGAWNTDAAPMLASDIARFIADSDITPITTVHTRRLADDDAESILQRALAGAGAELVDDYDWPANTLKQALQAAECWIRKGYRKAAKLYAHSAYEAAHWFRTVELEADRLTQKMDADSDAGTVLTVRIDRKALRHEFSIKSNWDY